MHFDDSKIKVIGKSRTVPMPGFDHMRGFAEMLNTFRGADVHLPRGIFCFKTFEEANEWWLKTMTVKFREPQP